MSKKPFWLETHYLPALTIRQPWAALIIEGKKDVENRSWSTTYRGPLLIAAAKQLHRPSELAAQELCMEIGCEMALPINSTRTGAVLGVVDLVDIVTCSSSKWAMDTRYFWILKNARRAVNPIPRPGGQRLWNSGLVLNDLTFPQKSNRRGRL